VIFLTSVLLAPKDTKIDNTVPVRSSFGDPFKFTGTGFDNYILPVMGIGIRLGTVTLPTR
jgi:hypothetical protein